MDFVKLRLAGFKSFVDSTELVIEPGLTGVVGPNGCGKSNLLEALRWVMGETSARKMRGGEMDDVIFGGTAKRPPRNIAEVVLSLDNRNRTAPAAFNDATELEVSRRIERGSGSDYRVNGKPVRARDVQLLFADHASGANSPALVSQGKVGALISAKPGERRQLLEEAAGISGLHSRRHEAELRLKGAEANLVRLDDVIAAMELQLQGLKKQAKHAARYRLLSEQVRRVEAVLWHLRWQTAGAERDRAMGAFQTAETGVRDLMLAVAQFTTQQTEAAAALPQLRQDEAVAGAALQRLTLARESLDSEERRVEESGRALKARLVQVAGDLGRERALAADAGAAVERLVEERQRLQQSQAREAGQEAAAVDALAEVREAVETLDFTLSELTEQVAADEAERAALVRQSEELVGRRKAVERRLAEQDEQRARVVQEMAALGDPELAEAAVAAAEERVERLRDQADGAERRKSEAEAAEHKARETAQTAEAALARIRAETRALADVLKASSGAGEFTPALDALTVTPGFEAALAAAFGGDLNAALDAKADFHWQTLPGPIPTPAWPERVRPLAGLVQAPAALARALSQTGCVDDPAAGASLAGTLAPGQTLVSPDGAAWRWDGLTRRSGAPTPAAIRLKQRNRLEELEASLEVAEARADTARSAQATAKEQARDAATEEKRLREALREAYAENTRSRDRHNRFLRDAAGFQSRLEAITATLERLTADLDEIETRHRDLRAILADKPESGPARERINHLRATLTERRGRQAEKQAELDRVRREAYGRKHRLDAIAAEDRSWRDRLAGADSRLAELEDRRALTEDELERLADRPAEIRGQRQELQAAIGEADRKRKRAADLLAAAEDRLAGLDRQLKKAEASLSDQREQRARAEAAVAAAAQAMAAIAERIAERLSCAPDQALAVAEVDPSETLPELTAVETRLERLVRERDNLGPVNLRAEMEADELEKQTESLRTERTDLQSAINRLRQGINALNKEARERLLASFESVNQNFQTLFVRLFGGGKAQLELTDAEDPLAAGLEVFASPPGKRLQNLSLLSGGEQALTALSLIFAVFMCNPAPICVLDEVDAPLDEANVNRLCSLLVDMGASGSTRFLIVTHHRMTMARLDRLFGVTMMERGVSQLVSVDLSSVEALRAVG